MSKQPLHNFLPPTHSLIHSSGRQTSSSVEISNFQIFQIGKNSKEKSENGKWKINSKLWVIKIIKLIYLVWYKNDVGGKLCRFPRFAVPWRGWIVSLFYHHLSSFIHSASRFASELLLFTQVIHSDEPLMPNKFKYNIEISSRNHNFLRRLGSGKCLLNYVYLGKNESSSTSSIRFASISNVEGWGQKGVNHQINYEIFIQRKGWFRRQTFLLFFTVPVDDKTDDLRYEIELRNWNLLRIGLLWVVN